MNCQLKGKKILLGITGGIAAYKSAELVRLLRRQGAQVRVVMTQGALEFITPMTMQALSGEPVFVDGQAAQDPSGMDHITLAKWPDVLVIAPASANFIARLAQGLADDLLATICLATTQPLMIAPAMNKNMWLDHHTQTNIETLRTNHIMIKGPASGEQACGDVGLGRMLEADAIFTEVCSFFQAQVLSGQHVVVTAGPTHEPIDPVRFLANRSSGKMGFALAQAFHELGAEVTLISGPVALRDPDNIKVIRVTTAQEMHDAVMQAITNADIFVGAAAVCDYRALSVAHEKIKKQAKMLQLRLEQTPDIITAVAALRPQTYVVGFAAETEAVIEAATAKLQTKGLDMIIANPVGEGVGFEVDENQGTVITQDGEQVTLAKMSKLKMAREIAGLVASCAHKKTTPARKREGVASLMSRL